MNKTNLKRYAPQARRDFIAAVTGRAQLLGLSERAGQVQAEPCTVQGDVALIAGRPWPASVQGQRQALIERMQRDGYPGTLEAVAYTWFNRVAALRFMELHDYLGHGRRVLSHPEGTGLPEVLAHALELAEAGGLPGLTSAHVRELKLANQDGELYRRTLIAQCNALHQAMPFLFEQIDDETELLLPDNLLLSDSIVAKLVAEIPEADWAEVEAIGWLYQFYISEKKDQVIGKVVKSEDIPAATQLFTPNWIVQYLVQNSVGRLWLMANPQSTLASQWPYYIQPAEQTPEVNAQLDALIQTRIREDGDSLNPESITVLDPACGSGHILVVAYDVLKAIYLERGYQPRAIPRLILEKNLYGLDIDDRAAQLAAFALLMKARADDRRLFTDPPKLNVLSLQESKGLDADELATHLGPFGIQRAPLKSLLDTFEHAKTFGSLIQIPEELNGQLAAMTAGLQQALRDGDLYAKQAAEDLLPLVLQALVLGTQFDAVVANPPYMGGQYQTSQLKEYVIKTYNGFEKDLFSVFVIRNLAFARVTGQTGFMSPFVWMFIAAYEGLREYIIDETNLTTLIQLEYSGFDGATVPICTFTIAKYHQSSYVSSFIRLSDFRGAEQQGARTLEAISNKNCGWFHISKAVDFRRIPGSPIAYWASSRAINSFAMYPPISDVLETREGLTTGNNARFLRYWWEVASSEILFAAPKGFNTSNTHKRWFPYLKGGDFRRWGGNAEYVVNWRRDGSDLRSFVDALTGRVRSHNYNGDFAFRAGLTWSTISSGDFSVRDSSGGFMFDTKGAMGFAREGVSRYAIESFLNSVVTGHLIKMVAPTLDFKIGNILKLPFSLEVGSTQDANARRCVEISNQDWADFETCWGYVVEPMINIRSSSSLKLSWGYLTDIRRARIEEMKALEEASNAAFIQAYGFEGELSPEVPEDQITLAGADREKDCRCLISYAIGCMMGRYSLDEPGLIYAHAGNVGFDPSRYEKKFPADADGIVPITDERWFEDDAASRVREFLRAVWGADTLEENMAWLAESLGTKGSETPDETIRRYLADKFFKDHLQTYKKRPIYWLFSSGKQGAFQALVYLHRYHEGTLARLRSEYVLPLTGKIQARTESLEADIRAASSTAARNKLTKQLESLRKQHQELLTYDEKLRHFADQRIALDLDDGVKVNYGKFGDLLAEVKAVTGGAGDE